MFIFKKNFADFAVFMVQKFADTTDQQNDMLTNVYRLIIISDGSFFDLYYFFTLLHACVFLLLQ